MSSINKIFTEENICIVICPNCTKTIPFITIVSNDDNKIELQFICSCTEQYVYCELKKYLTDLKLFNKTCLENCSTDSHAHLRAQKYCAVCQVWFCKDCLREHDSKCVNHLLFNRELIITCTGHKQPLKSYCNDCGQSICFMCSGHETHQISQIKDDYIESFSHNIKKIENVISVNLKYKNIFSEWIINSKQNDEWKTEVNDKYNHNATINNQLQQFIFLLKQTAGILGDYSPYRLSQSIESIKFNNENIDSEMSCNDLEKSYQTLTQYFTEKFIIVIDKKNIWEKVKTLFNYVNFLEEVKTNKGIFRHVQLRDKRILSSTETGEIKCWTPNFECFKTFRAHSNWISAIIELADGRIVTGSEDTFIQFWDINAYKSLRSIEAHDNGVTSVIQLRDSRLASCGADWTIKFWCVTMYECLKEITAHSSWVGTLIQLQDGLLASCGNDSLIKVWNAETFQCVTYIRAHSECVCSMIQLRNGFILTSGLDFITNMWQDSKFRFIKSIMTPKSEIATIYEMNQGQLMTLSSSDLHYIFA